MNLIRLQRRQSEMTQRNLADSLGVTRQAVSLWERGGRRPTPENRRELAHLLGVPESLLYPQRYNR